MAQKIVVSFVFIGYVLFRFVSLGGKKIPQLYRVYYNWNLPVMIIAYGLVIISSYIDYICHKTVFVGWNVLVLATLFFMGSVVLRNESKKELKKFCRSEILLWNDHELITSGIYGKLRHPYVVGVFLEVLSIVVFFRSIIGFCIFVVLYVPLLWLRTYLEDVVLKNYFGDSFIRYCQQIPAFVPRFTKQVR